MSFAENTTVPASKTRGEIGALVEKYGASQFSSGWMGDQAAVSFAIKGRLVRFILTLPSMDDAKKKAPKPRSQWSATTTEQAQAWIDQQNRRLWRCMLLAIKAKLEIVQTGIATFDEEFLAHIVTDNQMTIYERLKSAESGQKLLPPPGDKNVISIAEAKSR